MNGFKNFFLKNQTLRQTVFKNTFWLFIGQISGRVLRAAIVIYAARVLGAPEWGVFSYAISIAALLTIFTDLGINAMLVKASARLEPIAAENHRRQIISTSLFIKTIMIIVDRKSVV